MYYGKALQRSTININANDLYLYLYLHLCHYLLAQINLQKVILSK